MPGWTPVVLNDAGSMGNQKYVTVWPLFWLCHRCLLMGCAVSWSFGLWFILFCWTVIYSIGCYCVVGGSICCCCGVMAIDWAVVHWSVLCYVVAGN